MHYKIALKSITNIFYTVFKGFPKTAKARLLVLKLGYFITDIIFLFSIGTSCKIDVI